MAKRRKKRMRLPNGFGSIKYLGEGRRNPYAAYPPVTEWTPTSPVTPKAVAYRPTWEEAYEALTAYHMQEEGKIRTARGVLIDRSPLFEDVYEKFTKEKFGSGRRYSDATKASMRAAFKNCAPLHGRRIGELRYDDLQTAVNACPLKHSSLELIVSLLHQMYAYAMKYELVEKDYSAFLYVPVPEDDEQGEAFTDGELSALWGRREDPDVQMVLVMCYSGFRIKAYEDMEVSLEGGYFRGGVKTKAGVGRIVPIHSAIRGMVEARAGFGRNVLGCTPQAFREAMYARLGEMGIARSPTGKKHTPHDCRHTFSALCERYGVNENDRKRMLGHSFGGDITNAKYGHRTVEDLRHEIEKIAAPV